MASKKLTMTFINASGKKVSMSLDGIKDDVTKEQASNLMDTIISKNIFFIAGGDLKAKEAAQIISTDVAVLQVK